MPSRFRSVAMARGDFPVANSRKIRRTIAGAGDGGVLKSIHDLPTLPAHVLSTDAELVLDGGYALIVGRIPGANRNLEHDVLSGAGLHIDSTISAAVKMLVFTSARRSPFCSRSLTIACESEPSR
jgi:hypothetical protein